MIRRFLQDLHLVPVARHARLARNQLVGLALQCSQASTRRRHHAADLFVGRPFLGHHAADLFVGRPFLGKQFNAVNY